MSQPLIVPIVFVCAVAQPRTSWPRCPPPPSPASIPQPTLCISPRVATTNTTHLQADHAFEVEAQGDAGASATYPMQW